MVTIYTIDVSIQILNWICRSYDLKFPSQRKLRREEDASTGVEASEIS